MNQQNFKLVRALSAAATAAIAFASISHAQTAPPAAPATAMPAMTKADMPKGMMGSDGMKQSMMTGMDNMQKMQMTGDTDKDFAMMMKMHHQQALDMAQMELSYGKSPELKAMASKIIAAQKKEIAQFDSWLAKHK